MCCFATDLHLQCLGVTFINLNFCLYKGCDKLHVYVDLWPPTQGLKVRLQGLLVACKLSKPVGSRFQVTLQCSKLRKPMASRFQVTLECSKLSNPMASRFQVTHKCSKLRMPMAARFWVTHKSSTLRMPITARFWVMHKSSKLRMPSADMQNVPSNFWSEHTRFFVANGEHIIQYTLPSCEG